MRRALQAGADAIKLDVHLTRDNKLVVAHDRKLGRVSYGEGRISRLSAQQISKIDAAYWWAHGTVSDHHAPEGTYALRSPDAKAPTATVPSLDEVLDAFENVPLTIEVKAFRAAKALVDRLEERDRSQVTVTAFFTPILWQIRRRKTSNTLDLAPATAYTVWFWLRSRLPRPPRTSPYGRIQVPYRNWGITFVDEKFVAAADAANLKVDVWTIDDAEKIASLVELGIDGIMSDRPSELANVVRGASSSVP